MLRGQGRERGRRTDGGAQFALGPRARVDALGDVLAVGTAERVDDAALAGVVLEDPVDDGVERNLRVGGLGDDAVAQVGAVQRGAEDDGRLGEGGVAGRGARREAEDLEHVGDDVLGRRRRDGEDRDAREEDSQALEREVARAVVVAHRAEAVRLVNDEPAQEAGVVRLLERVDERLALLDALGRHVDELDRLAVVVGVEVGFLLALALGRRRAEHALHDALDLVLRRRRVDRRGRDVALKEVVDLRAASGRVSDERWARRSCRERRAHLVRHERDEGRDDDREAGRQERRDLVDEAFAAAGRHDGDDVAPVHRRVDGALLRHPPRRDAPHVLGELLGLARPRVSARYRVVDCRRRDLGDGRRARAASRRRRLAARDGGEERVALGRDLGLQLLEVANLLVERVELGRELLELVELLGEGAVVNVVVALVVAQEDLVGRRATTGRLHDGPERVCGGALLCAGRVVEARRGRGREVVERGRAPEGGARSGDVRRGSVHSWLWTQCWLLA